MIEFRSSGLAGLAARLERADRELDAEIGKAVTAELAKLPPAVRKSAYDKLPKHGGMAERFARNIETRIERHPGAARLSLIAPGRRERDLLNVDRGVVRHPVYGNRRVWASQVVKPYFWSEPVNDSKAAIEAAVGEALRRFGRGI